MSSRMKVMSADEWVRQSEAKRDTVLACRAPGCERGPFTSEQTRQAHEYGAHGLELGPEPPAQPAGSVPPEREETNVVESEVPEPPGSAACPVEGCRRKQGHSGMHSRPYVRRATGNRRKSRGGGPSVKKQRPDVSAQAVKDHAALEFADHLADRAEEYLTGDIAQDRYGLWRLGAAVADYRERRAD